MSGGGASRRKGAKGERELAQVFADAGHPVTQAQRNRVGEPDVITRLPLHGDAYALFALEGKRYAARSKFPAWIDQAKVNAPDGMAWMLCTRADRDEWLVTMRLADLLRLVG